MAEQEVHAVACCDYLVCGSALLLTIIAFCKNCINHVVTIQKRGWGGGGLVGINPQRRDSRRERTRGGGGRRGGEQGTRGSE